MQGLYRLFSHIVSCDERSDTMIISASRRTDIPSYYSEWFFNRIRAGYVYVRNPMNPHRISEVSLSPALVDGIVFWTKNPAPMLDRLEELRDYVYYFQFTLTPYEDDVERNIPSKDKVVIPAFRRLSRLIGRERVVWRYDPILLSHKYSMRCHVAHFRRLCGELAGYTEKCTISFIDMYKNIRRSISSLGISGLTANQMEELAGDFSEIAKNHGIYIDTCAEEVDLSRIGAGHASCIDRKRLERIGGCKLDVKKDLNQRAACGCVSSIDIGAYNTCQNGCVYCYANFNRTIVLDCCNRHDPLAPLLFGQVSAEDIVKPRDMRSCREEQLSFDI